MSPIIEPDLREELNAPAHRAQCAKGAGHRGLVHQIRKTFACNQRIVLGKRSKGIE